MTLAEALAKAENAVRTRYGPGHMTELVKYAITAALTTTEKPVSGWACIRGDTQPAGIITTDGPEAAEAVTQLKARAELVQEILDTFKPRKTGGGWNAYANDKTMQEWRNQFGDH